MFTRESTHGDGGPQDAAEGPLVDVEGVAKSYGRRLALENLSLTVVRGEIVGLVGGNGSGKTTTMRILAGLVEPEAGRGSVLGCDLRRQRSQIRHHVGYMSQRLALYAELSVLENLCFRAQVYGASRPRAVASAVIDEFGLTGYAGTAARNLSGGWVRRLQLAASTIHMPRLLLLDEPTAGLDAVSRHEVWRRLVQQAARGVSIVVSTHDLAEAEWCTRTVFLSDGRIVAAGTPEQVVQSAPAAAFMLSGARAHLVADVLHRIPGVLAVYPVGPQLRVIASDATEEALTSVAAVHGTSVARVRMRLEDAAIAFSPRHARAAT